MHEMWAHISSLGFSFDMVPINIFSQDKIPISWKYEKPMYFDIYLLFIYSDINTWLHYCEKWFAEASLPLGYVTIRHHIVPNSPPQPLGRTSDIVHKFLLGTTRDSCHCLCTCAMTWNKSYSGSEIINIILLIYM